MRAKVSIFKSGFLTVVDREILVQKVKGMGLVESHGAEAVSDLEMTVYLKWLRELVESLSGDLKKELKSYVDKHQEDPNPILDFFVSKYGRQTIVGQVPKALNEVLIKK